MRIHILACMAYRCGIDWDVDFEYPRKQTADNIKQKLTVMNFEQVAIATLELC